MAENLRDFIAGWVGGAAGILVGSPLDVLKARLQAPRTPYPGKEALPYTSAWRTLTHMIQYEGVSSLFKGVMSPVLGLAGLNAILFASYGGIMRYFESSHSQPGPFEPSLSQIYVAGCGAGIASFFFSAPTDLVKLQAQVSKVPKSSWNVAKSIYTNNGFRGFYQGGWATMIRDAPSYGLYFFVYEGTKRLLAVSEEETVDNASAIKILIAGGMAGVVSWTAIYPLDVIKSRLQMQVLPPLLHPTAVSEETRLHGQPVQPYTSIRDCIVRSYKTEGAGVFFRGIGPTILRGFPVNAVTFWVYELTLKAFLL